MIRAAVGILLIATAFAALPVKMGFYSDEVAETLFDQWITQNQKTYTQSEVAHRFAAFRANLEFVREHNEKFSNGAVSYHVEMNKFADMTSAEFKAHYLGYKFTPRSVNRTALNNIADESVDWRQKNAVTDVKNQGQCGSCWSFSTTGAVEGAFAIKTGKLVPLSEQELVDCDTVDQGCNGGLMDNAFDFIKENGITSEKSLPYKAHRSFLGCTFDKKKISDIVTKVSGHVDVATTEADLAKAVSLGPVSVAIEADQPGFQLYAGGIFDGECGTQLDHGVLAVGYGSENGKDFWIVKNSWAASWGDKGYIRLARNVAQEGGQCGIAMAASYPTI